MYFGGIVLPDHKEKPVMRGNTPADTEDELADEKGVKGLGD